MKSHFRNAYLTLLVILAVPFLSMMLLTIVTMYPILYELSRLLPPDERLELPHLLQELLEIIDKVHNHWW